MARKNINMGKLCNIVYAQNENSDLQITLHNIVVVFIQVTAKLRLQQKYFEFEKNKHRRSQIMKRKLRSIFLLKIKIRNSRKPQVL